MNARYSALHRTSLMGLIAACIAATTSSAGVCTESPSTSTGVGAALLAVAEDWARAQGFSTMRLRSNVIRERAHRFYEREGYRRIKSQAVFRKPLV